MAAPNVPTQDPYWWADPPLKERLLRDPAAVLKERGITAPVGLHPQIVQEALRIVSLLWVEGKVVPLERFYIDPADEGLLFGRGVWESTKTIKGVPWLWKEHIARLVKTAVLVDIQLAPERLPDSKQVAEYVALLTGQDVVIRLNVTAGRPGHTGVVWMSASLRPAPSTAVRLKSLLTPVFKDQPYLAWKTFQYASRLRIGQEAGKAGFDSSLMLDPDHNVLEAAHANIFFRLKDGWVTPSLGDGLFLPGTVRQYVLDHAPVIVREQVIPLSLMSEVTEAFVTNSNVGIVPVTQIDDHKYPVGPETTNLIKWIATT